MRAPTRPAGLTRTLVAVQILLLLILSAPAHAIAANAGSFGLNDKDFRSGVISPTSSQKSAVAALGAHASWTRFGTPASLIKYGGWLSTGLSGTPSAAARNWIRSHRTLFKLSDTDVTKMDLVADITLPTHLHTWSSSVSVTATSRPATTDW